MVTRRAFVATAPAAVLLAGCGAGAGEDVPEPKTRRVTSIQGDIELLTAAIDREAREAALYAAGPPKGHEETWRRFVGVEDEHVDRLRKALRALGAESTQPAGATNAGATLEDALDAEAEAVAFWIDALPKLYDPKLRSLCAGILTAEAEQLAVLRRALDLDPAPDAFVYGWTRHDEP